MKKKLVIFDLDNTLVITRPAAKHAYKQAIAHLARKHGLDKQADKLYHHWKKIVQTVKNEIEPHKRRFAHSLNLLLTEHKIPDTYFAEAINTYKKELLANLEPQRGAKDLLHWLKEEGHIIAVATASETSEAKKKLKSAHLKDYVGILITATEVGTMKPDVGYYERAMEEAGVKPKDTIVVGDSDNVDLKPARELGLKTILIPKGKPHLKIIKEELETYLGA